MEEKSYLGTDSEPVIPPTGDEKTIALLSHILTVVAPILAPLIIYLVKKNESPFIEAHAKESLNFQITLILVCIGLVITIIGIIIVWVVALIGLVLVVLATIKASEGKLYRYPVSIRFIK
jgi:uncharacterized Tic20 family protein